VVEHLHNPKYVERAKQISQRGAGYLDAGDMPAFPGVFEAASAVAGSVENTVRKIIKGGCRRAYVPIAGLHMPMGIVCVFNGCGVATELLRREDAIAYVDIGAQHGDGVFYPRVAEPDSFFPISMKTDATCFLVRDLLVKQVREVRKGVS